MGDGIEQLIRRRAQRREHRRLLTKFDQPDAHAAAAVAATAATARFHEREAQLSHERERLGVLVAHAARGVEGEDDIEVGLTARLQWRRWRRSQRRRRRWRARLRLRDTNSAAARLRARAPYVGGKANIAVAMIPQLGAGGTDTAQCERRLGRIAEEARPMAHAARDGAACLHVAGEGAELAIVRHVRAGHTHACDCKRWRRIVLAAHRWSRRAQRWRPAAALICPPRRPHPGRTTKFAPRPPRGVR